MGNRSVDFTDQFMHWVGFVKFCQLIAGSWQIISTVKAIIF